MATDLHAQLLGWASDEIDRQRLGEDYAVAVTLGGAPLQGPQGVQVVPVWQLLITARNPLLGQGPLYHFVPLPGPQPDEEAVRAVTADGLRLLRNLAASKLAASNGHAPVPPAGLARGHR